MDVMKTSVRAIFGAQPGYFRGTKKYYIISTEKNGEING